MTLEIFLMGLTVCSAFTALVTEAIKKMFGKSTKHLDSNVLAAICAVVVAVVTVVCYALLAEVAITTQFVVVSILLTIFSWIGAMVGYDKVIQTIKQITGKKEEE